MLATCVCSGEFHIAKNFKLMGVFLSEICCYPDDNFGYPDGKIYKYSLFGMILFVFGVSFGYPDGFFFLALFNLCTLL